MITGPDDTLIYREALTDPAQPTGLWWCQDERDAAVVGINAVSKNVLAPWSALNAWEAWAAQFPYLLLAIPPGPRRDEAAQEIMARLSLPVMVPAPAAFRGCESIWDLWEDGGQRALDRLLLEAEELPAQDLLNLADVDCAGRKTEHRTACGIPGLDRAVGGFAGGALSVWTGKRGEGKSTLAGQLLLAAADRGCSVCAYSGELPGEQFKRALLLQAAGRRHVREREDPETGRRLFEPEAEAARAIDAWWDRRLFLTDCRRGDAHDEASILKIFAYARRRYGCSVFLVDNIMTARLKDESQLGFWRAQSAFTGRLAAFCKQFDVHIHLVAHPRKTQGPLEADDVGGSSDITNRADNVFKVERTPEDMAGRAGYSTLLTVLKNREFGARARIKLAFDPPSRRLYQVGDSPDWAYGWERKGADG